jgi:ribokinase
MGCIGRDPHGDRLIEALAGNRIDLSATHRVANPTGVAFITVEAGGENRIIVIPGANHAFTPAHLPRPVAPDAVLLVQLEIPVDTVLAIAALVRESGGTVILNASPVSAIDAASRAALLEAADILLVNEIEAAALLGVPVETEVLAYAASAAKNLAQNRRAAVITLGAAGVIWCSGSESGHLPGHPIQVVDTTACGDAFAGAFASAIERGDPIQTAVAFGNAAGALAATQPGALPSLPDHAAISTFLPEHNYDK